MAPTRRLLAGILASFFLIPTPIAQADASSFVDAMPDPALRACVTDKLGLDASSEPTPTQLAGIAELSCTGRSIADATGTATMPNLKKLFLGNNDLTTVAPLATSDTIFSLGLANNSLTDVTALAALKELTNLDLAGNRLRDVSVLGTFPKAPLSGTRHGQRVTATPATAGVATLAPTLVGRDGAPFTATPPSGITVGNGRVTYPDPGTYTWTFRDPADLTFNGSATVEVREADPSLLPDTGLKACVNARLGHPADAEPTAADLASLSGTLACNGKGISDLTGVGLLTGLSTLTLNDNAIRNVAPLANHPSLVTANLKNNAISDLTGLGALPRLKTLDLSLNDVTSLGSLGRNTTLYTLRVGQTATSTHSRLTSLTGVDRLTGLGVLNINHTAVTSLAPLAGHPSLATLDAENAQLTDLGPLSRIETLNRVRLSGNRITDVSPLAAVPVGNIAADVALVTDPVTGIQTI